MTRIISDTYSKENKQIFGDDPSEPFNQKILAVNQMYGWLYDQGILEKVSFVFKDYPQTTYFALDVKDLVPYRKEMEAADLKDALLAVHHIFDEEYTPCMYSGAIELGWSMSTYRNVDGCVGSSWECSLIQHLNTEGIYDISRVQKERGVKEAVQALYHKFMWNPTLNEEKDLSPGKSATFDVKTQSTTHSAAKPEMQRLSFVDDIGYTEFEVSKDWYDSQSNKEDVANLFHLACADETASHFNDVTGKYYEGKCSLLDQIESASTRAAESHTTINTKAKEPDLER